MNQEYSRRKRRERLVKGAALLSFCLLSVGFLYLSIFLDQKVLDYPNIVNTLDAVPFLILFVCVISVYNKVYDFANRRMYRQLYSVGVTLFLIQVFMVSLPYFGYEFRISKKVMLLSLLLQGAICFLWLGMFRKIYFTAVKPYRVLLIEGSGDAESIRLKFLFSSRKYRIEKILEEGEEGMGEAIREYGVVMLSNVNERTKEEVIAQCSREQKKVIIRPKASDILLVNAGVEQIDDLLLVSSRRLRLREGAGAGETLHGRSCFPAALLSEQPAHPGIGFTGVHGGQGEPVLHAGEADQGRGEVSDLQAEDDEGREREGDRACEEGGRKDHEGGEGAEEVPDRRASAAFERSEGGDEPDRTKTGAGVLLPAVRQDDAGVPVPSEREGRAERVRPGMGEVQYEAEGEADDGSDVHPGLFVSVGHQADAGNGQGGVRS